MTHKIVYNDATKEYFLSTAEKGITTYRANASIMNNITAGYYAIWMNKKERRKIAKNRWKAIAITKGRA